MILVCMIMIVSINSFTVKAASKKEKALQAAQNTQDMPLTSEQLNEIPENPEGVEFQNMPVVLNNKTVIKNSPIEKASNAVYELDQELLNYTNVNIGTGQYACEAAGGIYFLQGRYLRFWDYKKKNTVQFMTMLIHLLTYIVQMIFYTGLIVEKSSCTIWRSRKKYGRFK